jgi:hypothetical protein
LPEGETGKAARAKKTFPAALDATVYEDWRV